MLVPRNSAVRQARPAERRVALIAIAAAFAISRILALSAGLRFRVPLDFHQFLDTKILSSHLLQSIYYLHYQPPLLNLALGIGAKLFPDSYPQLFRDIYAAIGLLLSFTLYELLLGIGALPSISLVATLLFEIGPATLLFENLYYDTYPTAALLCFAAYFLNRFLSSGSRIVGVAFVIASGLLVFLNPSFQIWWFVGVWAILCLVAYDRMRTLIPAALSMLALILLLYIKNFLVFGTFATGSWSGLVLSTTTTMQLSVEERQALIRKGELSALALQPMFPTVHVPKSELTGIAALDEEQKLTWAGYVPNGNTLAYIRMSRTRAQDAIWVVLHRPAVYARGAWRATKCYLEPATADLPFLQRRAIERWCLLYETCLNPGGLQVLSLDRRDDLVGLMLDKPATQAASTILMIALPACVVFAAVIVLRAWMTLGLNDPRDVTLLFIIVAILYATPLGAIVNYGENNRYRFILDPLYVALFGLLLSKIWDRIASWHQTDDDRAVASATGSETASSSDNEALIHR